MNLRINPVATLRGTIDLPASKSYSIRAFLVAACGGRSIIKNPSDCDDSLVAMSAARCLGAKITKNGKNSFRIDAPLISRPIRRINVKESGTVLRLILPLAAMSGGRVVVSGEGTLKGRPNHFLIEAMRRMGVKLSGTGPAGSIPIHIHGGKLQGGGVEIDGSLSSQFISALLIACPRLDQDTELLISGKKIVSESYITMTLQILKKAGIGIRPNGRNAYFIPGRQHFAGLKSYSVPSDYGLAAFFMAAASLIPSDVTFRGHFDDRFLQADGQILHFLKRMGVRWERTSRAIRMRGPFQLKGGDFSLKDSPDLVPIMAVLALFAKGRTRLLDIGHARAKESDRIEDLKKELVKIGASLKAKEDSLTIDPGSSYKNDCYFDPHHDHRLAMAFSVLGLKLGAIVKDIECTRKSYPGFVLDLKKLVPRHLRLPKIV